MSLKKPAPNTRYAPAVVGRRMGFGTGVKSTLRSLQTGRPASLGAIWGDSGSVSRSPLGKSDLGSVKGDNGSITHRAGFGVQGGLGTISGNKGAVNHRPGFGNIGSKGGQLTDSGAIGKHHGFSTVGGLNQIRGNSGAIKRSTLTGADRMTLGAVRGDSGAIRRTPIATAQRYNLGATRGNSGAITRTNTFFATGALGSVSGNSGAIGGTGRGTFKLVASPLGGRSGDQGAISRTPVSAAQRYTLGAVRGDSGAISRTFSHFGSRGGLGGTFGNSGAIKRSGGRSGGLSNSGSTGRSGSSGGSGLRSGSKKVGGSSKARSGKASYKARPVVVIRQCCGDPVSGSYVVTVTWEHDAETGQLLEPKNTQLEAKLNGANCTPDRWTESGLWFPGVAPVVVSATVMRQTVEGTPHGFCATIRMDHPGDLGKLVGRARTELKRDQDRIIAPVPGMNTTVTRYGVWSRGLS